MLAAAIEINPPISTYSNIVTPSSSLTKLWKRVKSSLKTPELLEQKVKRISAIPAGVSARRWTLASPRITANKGSNHPCRTRGHPHNRRSTSRNASYASCRFPRGLGEFRPQRELLNEYPHCRTTHNSASHNPRPMLQLQPEKPEKSSIKQEDLGDLDRSNVAPCLGFYARQLLPEPCR